MKVACDADGLIKMAKAGILEVFAQYAELLIGPQVYREAVEEGKARGYPDALDLERILKVHAQVPRKLRRTLARTAQLFADVSLGAGEREALQIYFTEQADAVLSDDQAFLSALEAQGIPFLTPAAVLVFLAERKLITLTEAYEALERLRPLIRSDQYEMARQDLNSLTERSSR